MSIVNSTRSSASIGYLRGYAAARGHRQPVSPAQPRVPPGAVADRARRSARCRSTSAASTSRCSSDIGDRVRHDVRRRREPPVVARWRAAARRVLRLLRPGHVRDRLLARPDQAGGVNETWFLLTGSSVRSRDPARRRGRDRGRAPARRAVARPARSARARRRSPRASRRDVDRADAVSVALAADAAPGSRRGVPRGSPQLARRLDELDRALATATSRGRFDLAPRSTSACGSPATTSAPASSCCSISATSAGARRRRPARAARRPARRASRPRPRAAVAGSSL